MKRHQRKKVEAALRKMGVDDEAKKIRVSFLERRWSQFVSALDDYFE